MSGGKVLGADARSSLYPGERRSARGPSGFGTTVRRRRGAADVSGDSSRRDSCDAFLAHPGSSAPLAPRSPHQLLGGVRGVVGGVRGVVGGVSENVVRYAVNAQPRPRPAGTPPPGTSTPPSPPPGPVSCTTGSLHHPQAPTAPPSDAPDAHHRPDRRRRPDHVCGRGAEVSVSGEVRADPQVSAGHVPSISCTPSRSAPRAPPESGTSSQERT